MIAKDEHTGNRKFQWEQAKIGNAYTLKVILFNEVIRLHSQYDPIAEAKKIVTNRQFGDLVFVVGFGAGYLIDELMLRQKESIRRIVCFEPIPELLKEELLTSKISTYPSEVEIFDVASNEFMSLLINDIYSPLMYEHVSIAISPGYHAFQRLQGLDFEALIRKQIDSIQSDFVTQSKMGLKWIHNLVRNLAYCENISPFRPSEHKEVVVIGAGPTLSEHRHAIATFSKNKTFLICADSALSWCLSQDIVPDAVMSIDAQTISYVHTVGVDHFLIPKIIDIFADPSYLQSSARVLLLGSTHPLVQYVWTKQTITYALDTRGGNVGQSMIDFASRYLKATNIRCFGLDFAYPGGNPYVIPSFYYTHACRTSSRIRSSEQILQELYLGEPHNTYSGPHVQNIIRTKRLEAFFEHFVASAQSNLNTTTAKDITTETTVTLWGASWDLVGTKFSWDNNIQPVEDCSLGGISLDKAYLRDRFFDYIVKIRQFKQRAPDMRAVWEEPDDKDRTLLLTLMPLVSWACAFILKQNRSPADIHDIRQQALLLACDRTTYYLSGLLQKWGFR